MSSNLYKILSFFMAFALIFVSVKPATAASVNDLEMVLNIDGVNQVYYGKTIKLVVNGKELNNLEMPPITLSEQMLVPVADVLTTLGAAATWYENYRELLVGFHNSLISLKAGDTNINIDGLQKPIPNPPVVINNKLMVTTSTLSDGLGLTVTWDEINRMIYVWDNTKLSTSLPTISQLETSPPIAQTSGNPTPAPTVNEFPAPIYGTEDLPESLIAERANDISAAPIEAQSHPTTKITDLITPGANDNTFIIKAASEISSVEKILLPDNRIVLDIYNAEFALGSSTYEVTHPNVQQVRAAQNQTKPEMITRIVFDIKAASDFSVELSADRKSIMVSFQRNAVLDIQFSTNGESDIITLYTQNHATLNVFPLSDPKRIIIDTPNSDMKKLMDAEVNGKFVKSVKSSLFESRTARIELEMSEDASYEIMDMGTTISIVLNKPTYKNIEYDTETGIIKFAKASGVFIDINAIALNDEYNDLKYTLTLPANFENSIGYGEYIIKDDLLRSILVRTVDGRTQITLFEKQILALTIYEDSQNVYIKLMKPHEKYNKIVVLDPGHGGRDNGTDGFGLYEKDIVLDIVQKIMTLLEIDGSVKAYTTRSSDVYPDLHERVAFTADATGDLFISVHVNAAENNAEANGTEVFWYPHENDAQIGYSSQNVANILHKNLLAKLGTRDRTVKEESHVVTKYNTVPAALVETAFLSNPAEAQKLGSDYFRMQAADAIYLSIIEIFNEYTPKR